MSFFKHVGTANGGKKVIIVQRQLPGEEHMASVLFSDILPSRYHDDTMKVLESLEGQAANEFKDVLERRFFSTGENMLQTLHSEGFIKKLAANAITVRPNSKSSIRLDELTKLLTDISSGRHAQSEMTRENISDFGETIKDTVTATVEESKPAAPAEEDRLAKLERMMMGLAETVQSLAETKKSSGRPSTKKS
jgi:hypothetical protein